MASKRRVINVSEIGQYHYCSISWYLQKCGYKPKSKSLEIGLNHHKKLGNTINQVNKNLIKSRIISLVGYILLFFGFLFFIFEVVL